MIDTLKSIDLVNMVNTDPFLLFFGCFFFILGLSVFTTRECWEEYLDILRSNTGVCLMNGIFTLPIALFIIFFYDNWDWLAPGALMIVGYIGLLKALVMLLRPQIMQKFLKLNIVRKLLWLDGVSGMILGAILLLV